MLAPVSGLLKSGVAPLDPSNSDYCGRAYIQMLIVPVPMGVIVILALHT